jgi:hypothetical protein
MLLRKEGESVIKEAKDRRGLCSQDYVRKEGEVEANQEHARTMLNTSTYSILLNCSKFRFKHEFKVHYLENKAQKSFQKYCKRDYVL